MKEKKRATARKLGSNLKKVDAHVIQPHEYDEIPEVTDEMIARGFFKPIGRPLATDPRLQVTLRLPASKLARWKASGRGWQTRMAALLEKRTP